MTLDELKIGEKAKVLKVNGEGSLRRRILDMGVTKNTIVKVKKFAPLGDPMELNIRGYSLSIRKNDAVLIEVERI